ncbi:NAD(P)H-dependent oxidoreductase [bacterium]|nr:MAG: NAD(P)H-dependent oxidoreductase [bacterium]
MPNIPKIQIILGSTRRGREGEKVAKWILNRSENRQDLVAELLDLRDWPLPFFDEPMSPSVLKGNYSNDTATRWAAKVKEADAYIIVTPEYNHGYPGVLKNALDYAYSEWNTKPVAFVGYSGGPLGGARAVEQLRQVVLELQMVPLRAGMQIGMVGGFFDDSGKAKDASMNDRAKSIYDQLVDWANFLRTRREQIQP